MYPHVTLHPSLTEPRSEDLVPRQSVSIPALKALFQNGLSSRLLLAKDRLISTNGFRATGSLVTEVLFAIAYCNSGLFTLVEAGLEPPPDSELFLLKRLADLTVRSRYPNPPFVHPVYRFLRLLRPAERQRLSFPGASQEAAASEAAGQTLEQPHHSVAGLLAAAEVNQEETWAAVTNFHSWRFFKVSLLTEFLSLRFHLLTMKSLYGYKMVLFTKCLSSWLARNRRISCQTTLGRLVGPPCSKWLMSPSDQL